MRAAVTYGVEYRPAGVVSWLLALTVIKPYEESLVKLIDYRKVFLLSSRKVFFLLYQDRANRLYVDLAMEALFTLRARGRVPLGTWGCVGPVTCLLLPRT